MKHSTALIWGIVTRGTRLGVADLALDLLVVAALQLVNLRCLHLMLEAGAGAQRGVALCALLASLLLTSNRLGRLERRCAEAFDAHAYARTVSLLERFRGLSLLRFEAIERDRISIALTVDLERLRKLGANVTGVLTGLTTSVLCLGYIAVLSPVAGVVAAIWLALTGWSTYHLAGLSQGGQRRLRGHRRRVASLTRGLVRGFSQARLHRERSDDIAAAISAEARAQRDALDEIEVLRAEASTGRDTGRLVVLALIGFGLPLWVPDDRGLAALVLFVALFALRYVLLMATQLAFVVDADDLLDRMADFEALLPAHVVDDGAAGGAVQRLELREVTFAYPPDGRPRPFALGPVSLVLEPGSLIFVVGANGSGKSSLIKVLSGLFPATGGEIRVDGHAIGSPAPQSHRESFSIILADPVVHPRPYGLEGVDPARVEACLRLMELEHVVSYADGRFDTVALSTGQRKRLAMVVLLLEDRPICVFDEWAADQDPRFKARFYDALLPSLRARGKMVIVISHDDGWFDRADRVITLRDGQVMP